MTAIAKVVAARANVMTDVWYYAEGKKRWAAYFGRASGDIALGTASCAQPQPVFVVNRYDESGLASEIETMEIVSLGFEDHGSRSHAVP